MHFNTVFQDRIASCDVYIMEAKAAIVVIFANSDGCNVKTPKSIQRVEPNLAVPNAKVITNNKNDDI